MGSVDVPVALLGYGTVGAAVNRLLVEHVGGPAQLEDLASRPRSPARGPTVIVWARPESATACAAALAERFPDTDVLHLSISPTGAGQL